MPCASPERPPIGFAFLSLLATGAIFGFFYAWVCSTMWGLDATDPVVAITAMQAMNASVRNMVFAPAFFGTPVILAITGALAWRGRRRLSAKAFLGAAAIHVVGVVLVTAMFNLPMNEALALVQPPVDPDQAQASWTAYSYRWQAWNIVRAVASGLSLMLTGCGLLALMPRQP